MAKLTALITGGLGYIGSHVTKALHQRGWRTIVVDTRGNPQPSKYVDQFYAIDIRSDLSAPMESNQIHAVFHLAGLIDVAESTQYPSLYHHVNVGGTINLLHFMEMYQVPHLVFSSSAAVYGAPVPGYDEPLQQVFCEYHEKDPVNPYGMTKWMAEQIIKEMRSVGIDSVCLRYFNVAGADPDSEMGENHECETHFIPRILAQAASVYPLVEIFGNDYETPDGTCIRDYVHVSDVAMAHVNAVEFLLNNGPTASFNIGLGMGYSNREVVQTVSALSGVNLLTRFKPRRAGDPPALIADPSNAAQFLHFHPQYELTDMIRTAMKWTAQGTA